ncbi:MAG TPA: energy transducer TonB [Candidatus Limnocylindria bacterium]|nr:energy transducer TonB [Candidatus Limnocylindria bacterium]
MNAPSISIAALAPVVAMLAYVVPAAAEPTRASHQACMKQATPATISRFVPADYPIMAAQQNVSGIARVRVDLTRTGTVLNATIDDSSGNELLDRAALVAARQQTYSPQVVSCRPVSGSYAITVDFLR